MACLTNDLEYYVIHLSDRTDRLNHIRKMEKRINHKLNIFDASGPSVLAGFLPGEVGCYQSHMRLLGTPKTVEYTVILEDDFVIGRRFHSRVQKMIRDAGEFDILYLGNLDGNHAKRVKGDVYKVNADKYLTGTHGYVVKNDNAWKITSQLRYQKPIDLELMDLINSGAVNGLVVWPSIVAQNSKLVSSIRVCETRGKRCFPWTKCVPST